MGTQIGKTRMYRDVDEDTSALKKQCPQCQVFAVPRGIADVSPQATMAEGVKHCPNCGYTYGRKPTYTAETRITAITVTGTGDASTITVDGALLQMVAVTVPAKVTNAKITWTVTDGTGTATISVNGVLTPLTNGDVTVTAGANDGSMITATKVITLSNQA